MEDNIQICLIEERQWPNIWVQKKLFEALKKSPKNVTLSSRGRGKALVVGSLKKYLIFAASPSHAKSLKFQFKIKK